MQILIYGCTRLTDALAPILLQDGHQVTVMDTDADRLVILEKQAEVNTIWVSEPHMQDYMLEGGIASSDAFYSLTDDDHKNLLLSQIATHIFNVSRVMCRLTDPRLREIYQPLGVIALNNGPDFLSSAREILEQ